MIVSYGRHSSGFPSRAARNNYRTRTQYGENRSSVSTGRALMTGGGLVWNIKRPTNTCLKFSNGIMERIPSFPIPYVCVQVYSGWIQKKYAYEVQGRRTNNNFPRTYYFRALQYFGEIKNELFFKQDIVNARSARLSTTCCIH